MAIRFTSFDTVLDQETDDDEVYETLEELKAELAESAADDYTEAVVAGLTTGTIVTVDNGDHLRDTYAYI